MSPTPSFPRHPGKWRHPSIVQPRHFVDRYARGGSAPRRCVLMWNRSAFQRLADRLPSRPLPAPMDAYRIGAPSRSLALALPRGVGAPTTISGCEELVAMGTREFVGIGYAGALAPDLAPGDIVVCDGAVRDEGTSHHYAPAHVTARPSRALTRWVERTLVRAGLAFRVGPSWTTDAPYRETRAELRRYRREGVLTVDMEASALFVFARFRRVRAASVFVISDVLTERGWDPHFHAVGRRLVEVAGAVLRARPAGPAP